MTLHNALPSPEPSPLGASHNLAAAAMTEICRLVAEAQNHLLNDELIEATSSLQGLLPHIEPLIGLLTQNWVQHHSHNGDSSPGDYDDRSGPYL